MKCAHVLFQQYLGLDAERRREIFPELFGRMQFFAAEGTAEQQAAAIMFFAAVRSVISCE